jgi:protein-tyrosine phosphatase
LCRALVADGITHVIATPHQLGNYCQSNRRSLVLESVAALQEQLLALKIPLSIEPGADVRVDELLLDLLDSNEILTLGDGRLYILLEMPHETLIDLRPLLQKLTERGIRGILSHPERQFLIAKKPELVTPWIQVGALLQITSGSLLGEFGPMAEAASWRLIEAGAVSLIASDAHDVESRPPRMTQAIKAISNRLGHAVARRLCVENPNRILSQLPIQSPRISRRFGGG